MSNLVYYQPGCLVGRAAPATSSIGSTMTLAERTEAAQAINDLLAGASILTSISNDLMAEQLEQLAGDALTFAQLKLLRLVARRGTLSVSDVAAFLGVSTAAASKAVDRLVRAGYLHRAASPDDRRALRVTITGEAQALLATYERATAESLTARLGTNRPAALRRLADELTRLAVDIGPQAGEEMCFRCGIYFRDHCLLREMRLGTCYLHLAERKGEVA
jgi:DNA-binding MarR family transcriptional regulator